MKHAQPLGCSGLTHQMTDLISSIEGSVQTLLSVLIKIIYLFYAAPTLLRPIFSMIGRNVGSAPISFECQAAP